MLADTIDRVEVDLFQAVSPREVQAGGTEVVDRSYPYSADLSTLDWNRSAAIRLLSEMAARSILDNFGEKL